MPPIPAPIITPEREGSSAFGSTPAFFNAWKAEKTAYWMHFENLDWSRENNLQGDEYNLYLKVYDIISAYLPKPEIIIYLYNQIDQLLSNIARRGRDFEQDIAPEYLQDIQSSYMNYLSHLNNIPVVLVDTHELDFVKYPEHYSYLKSLLDRDFENGLNRVIPREEGIF